MRRLLCGVLKVVVVGGFGVLLAARPSSATPITVFTENFDSVVAGTLPTGWVSPVSSSGTFWTTSTIAPFSAPNAAATSGPSDASVTLLLSPLVAMPVGTDPTLTFENSFDLEADSFSFFDGGLVGVSIDGGLSFSLLGDFSSGGYNGQLSTQSGNPFGGSLAWTGDSGGYITTTVLLPTFVSGEPDVQFAWFLATDSSVSSPGWWIDNVLVETTVADPVPEPTTLLLFGTGLVAAGVRRYRQRQQ